MVGCSLTAAFVHGPLPSALRGPLSTHVHATPRKGALPFFTSFSLRHFERLESEHVALHTSVFSHYLLLHKMPHKE